jgi:hypothetical protein
MRRIAQTVQKIQAGSCGPMMTGHGRATTPSHDDSNHNHGSSSTTMTDAHTNNNHACVVLVHPLDRLSLVRTPAKVLEAARLFETAEISRTQLLESQERIVSRQP